MSPDRPVSTSANVAIIGASARAAAFSAIRSGLTPICWDLYADVDLKAAADVEQIPDLADDGLLRSASLSQLPLIYAGGMENHPQWLRRAGDAGILWGNPESVVRNIRNPLTVAETMQATRLPVLDVRASDSPPEPDGGWLLKPRYGAGGRGIVPWTLEAADHPTLRESHYFQKRVEGKCISAVFVGREQPGDVEFVGISQQLIGWSALHAPPFAWCGSVGPIMLSIPCEHKIRRIGNVLTWKFQLRGLFGVDFIVDSDETPWVTEINPRYPASTEIFELACGFTLLRAHAQAFGMRWEDEPDGFRVAREGMVGKGILYATRDLIMPEVDDETVARPDHSLGCLADLSPQGAIVREGHPVCSFLVEADSHDSALASLQEAAAQFDARLETAEDAPPFENRGADSTKSKGTR